MVKKVYFASDFHFGIDGLHSSGERERRAVRWLDMVAQDAASVYLVGDLFDFWFEYGSVVPKGFTRFLGKLAEMSDSGLSVEVFTGNHDLWMSGYFQEELGIPVHHVPIERVFQGKRFVIGHGDGLGPGDYGYKAMKTVFKHPLAQWLFRWVHPDLGIALARAASGASRKSTAPEERAWLGAEREWLYQYCMEQIEQGNRADFFVFGHRHLSLDRTLPNGSRYINLGEWLYGYTYAVWDGADIRLEAWT